MLSRTADHLFWLARYVERSEYIARILDVAYRLSSLPVSYGGGTNEWESAIETAGVAEPFRKIYDEANVKTVIEYLAFSPDNPSSIRNCFEMARTNARSVRTALTAEMWSTINDAWLQLQSYKSARMSREQIARFLDWVKSVSLVFDGSAYRTMLRSDSYCFSRLGMFIERADNTARILDVKYHVLLPPTETIGGGLDHFQWTAILRAVSAQTAYHWVYKESLKPWLVADLLILNEQMPRSLAACYENVNTYLDFLAQTYGRQGVSQRKARNIRVRLQNRSVENIFKTGLHEFLTDFIEENTAMSSTIAEQYLLG